MRRFTLPPCSRDVTHIDVPRISESREIIIQFIRQQLFAAGYILLIAAELTTSCYRWDAVKRA